MKYITNIRCWEVTVLLLCAFAATAYGADSNVAAGKAVVSLVGTTWSGTDSDGDFYVFTFEHNGTLAYVSPTGSYRNGKWNQFNNAVYLEMNDHHSEYLGEIDGDRIEGKAWNRARRVWVWKMTKNK